MSNSPARRWILSAVVAAVLVVAAIVAARAIRDDDTPSAADARGATTSSAVTTVPSSTTAPPVSTTVAAPTTTAAGPTTSTTGPPGPCGADTAAIRLAVGTALGSAAPGPDLAECRLAASDPSWAAARVGTTIVVVHRDAGAWAVVAQGGTNAGCGQAPQQVIVDLGQFCVGSGGGAA
jgi:hypothetical protein